MITKAQALALHHSQTLHYTGRKPCTRTVGPRGGVQVSIVNVRVSGQCKTWKTRPEDFRLPVKHGLYENGAIDQTNAGDWHTEEDCPLNQPATDS